MSTSPETWRDRLPGRRVEPDFHWRGKEVSRLEGFSDTIFAFAITLLVVALEVPHDFEGLVGVVKGFPAFVVCFYLLMAFWSTHYRFFRRYGLEDGFTHKVNYAILLMVLFASYPLKFLFTALFGQIISHHDALTGSNWEFLYRAYGLGLGLTWALFGLLYWHAHRLRDQLALTPIERLHTCAAMGACFVYVVVCALSILLTFFPVNPATPGMIYFLIGIGMWINYGWYGKRVQRQREAEAVATAAPKLEEPVTPSPA